MTAAADSNPPGELYCTTCEKTFHVGDKCPTDGTRLMRIKAALDPLLGRDLDGRYTVIEKLGQGGMGAVYRAQQHSVDREVAIKVVNANLITDPDVIKRFLREAKLASKLAHPNAVAVLDFNQTADGVFYLAMELVSGRPLDVVLRAEKVFKPERLVRIGTQVLDALEGAHALSIIHRDLKPSNIMLLAKGRDLVKVLDFGLAKSISPDQTSTTMTGVGAVLGTPAFMPPELARGIACDGRADLYSLGVILYQLGTGRLPFVSDSVHELLALHGSDEPAPPMTGVPPRLAQVIDTLLQKDPAKRYQSAAEALRALESSLAQGTPGLDQDTNPSLVPFPAESAQFAHLATPSRPSRRAPTKTEAERLVTEATMLATPVPSTPNTATPKSAAAETTLPQDATVARSRVWVGLAALVAIAAVVVGVVAFGQSKKTPREPDPVVAPSPPDPAPPPSEQPVSPTPAEARAAATAGSAATTASPPQPADASAASSAKPTRPRATSTTGQKPPGKRPPPSKPAPTTPSTATNPSPATTKPADAGSAVAPPF
ncbi:MAG: protein kinase [Kofleriaceae bacterium]|nr:protein kinase [Kofleriaceae bacterium]